MCDWIWSIGAVWSNNWSERRFTTVRPERSLSHRPIQRRGLEVRFFQAIGKSASGRCAAREGRQVHLCRSGSNSCHHRWQPHYLAKPPKCRSCATKSHLDVETKHAAANVETRTVGEASESCSYLHPPYSFVSPSCSCKNVIFVHKDHLHISICGIYCVHLEMAALQRLEFEPLSPRVHLDANLVSPCKTLLIAWSILEDKTKWHHVAALAQKQHLLLAPNTVSHHGFPSPGVCLFRLESTSLNNF